MLSYHTSTCLAGLETPTKHHNQDRKLSVRESNQDFPEKKQLRNYPASVNGKSNIDLHPQNEKHYSFY
jgi:hypothetical protein